MAKIKEDNEVKVVDVNSGDELKATIEMDYPEPVYEYDYIPEAKNSLGKNIITGVGIAAAGGLAAYGLYHLVKKGVGFIKKLKKSKEESIVSEKEVPKYEYEKAEENSGKTKAKAYKRSKIGFKYNK